MDLDQLAKLGEFLGGVVVVISVLYLALQARQAAIAQRAENYERTNARASAVLSQMAGNPELNKLVIDGCINFEQLDPYERYRVWQVMYENFSFFEFTYEQHRLNAIPDHVWERFRSYTEGWCRLPGFRASWAFIPMSFSPGFKQFVQAELRKPAATEDQAAQFWGFAPGEYAQRAG